MMRAAWVRDSFGKLITTNWRGFARSPRAAGATSISRWARAPASVSLGRWFRAHWKAVPRLRKRSGCSGFRKMATFRELALNSGWDSDGLPPGRQRFHPGEEPALRTRLLPGFLGMADHSEVTPVTCSASRRWATKYRRWKTTFRYGQGARGGGFFLPVDAAAFPSLSAVSAWAQGQRYEPAAISTFLQVADYYLVAQAHAGHHTVVTHEIPSASTRRIKIPDACIGLQIKCMTPFEMLRRERARFILGPQE